MATFTREPGTGDPYRYVKLVNGALDIRFDTWFGGAPLQWFYQGQEIISSHPGEGFQPTIDEGQDLTQATANGETTNHIQRTVDTNDYNNYYLRESVEANFPVGATFYQTVGFYPDFWLSHEAQDDSIPPYSNGTAQAGWKCLHTDPTAFESPNGFYSYAKLPFPVRGGGAIFFEAIDSVKQSGIFMEANAIRPVTYSWQDRLREFQDGRIAFKVRISLSEASANAYGGILFRRSVSSSASTMDDVFNAPGYALNVNRSGLVELRTHDNKLIWSTTNASVATSVNSQVGCLLELRTFNSLDPNVSSMVEVWADQVNLTPGQIDLREDAGGQTVPVYLGPHFGLIGATDYSSTKRNYIKFCDRQVFNVGTEVVFKATPGMDGNAPYVDTQLIVRNASGLPNLNRRHLYRVNIVSFLLRPSGVDPFTFVWTEKPPQTIFDPPTTAGSYARLFLSGLSTSGYGTIDPTPADAFWAGKGSATLGIYCIPLGVGFSRATFARGEHAYVDAALNPANPVKTCVCHINALPIRKLIDTDPPYGARQVNMTARWYPYRA